MANATIEIDTGSGYQTPGESQDMPPAGGFVYLRIVDMTGIDPTRISWTNFGTHNSTQASLDSTVDLQGNPTGQIARFTVPASTDQAYGFRLDVNGGEGVTNGDSSTIGVYVLNGQGRRPFFIGETDEDNSTHYSVPRLNEISAAAGPGSAGAWKQPVEAANAVALPANTRVSNTYTADAVGPFPLLDGQTISVGDTFLYWTGLGATHADYGILQLDVAGDGATAWVASRVPLADESAEVFDGMHVQVQTGTLYEDHLFVQVSGPTIVLNTTALEFVDRGSLLSLVTATDSGTINALGADGTVLQSDGTTAGGVWQAFLALGAVAAVASAGDIRLADVSSIQGWGGGPVNVPMLAKTAGDDLYVGLGLAAGANPPNLYMGANSGVSTYINGNARLVQADAYLEMGQGVLRFGTAVATPQIVHKSDPTDGVVADTLLTHAQDATHGVNGTGGGFDIRPGSGPTAGGQLALQNGAGVDFITINDAATTIECITTAHWDAAGYARLGKVAGSGAGSAAATGGVRLQGNGAVQGRITFRNAVDGGDVAGMSLIAADALNVGGPYPVRPGSVSIDVAAAPGVIFNRVNGATRLQILNSSVTLNVCPLLTFSAITVAPVINQTTDATASVVCDTLTVEAQGASNAVGGASAGTSGALLLRGGRGSVHVDNTDGNVALHEVPGAGWQSMEEGLYVGDAVTAPVAAAAAGAFLWSEGALLHAYGYGTPAAGFARIGLVAGSGAGSAAAVGGLRMQGNGAVQGQIVFRNITDAGDLAGMSCIAATNELIVGGAYPTRPAGILFDPQSYFSFRIANNEKMAANATTVVLRTVNLEFSFNTATPSINQAADATAGIAGDLFTTNSQDVSGTGATVGGARLDRAGDATGADANTGGNYDMRPGDGGVHGGSVGGQIALQNASAVDRVAVDDIGIGFFAVAPVARQDIVGAKAGNAALADLLTKLALTGLITDSTA